MNRHNSVFFLLSILIVPASSVLTWAQEPQFLDAYEFNQETLAGNG